MTSDEPNRDSSSASPGAAPPDWFDEARYVAHLERAGAALGRPLSVHGSTESTNDLALSAERAGAPEGSTFVAWEQTRGRGRRGNAWWAAPGDNLTCSWLLRPDRPASEVSSLPLIVGLAVRDVVVARLTSSGNLAASFFPAVQVKWPNDVWVGARKIAGVLVESRLHGNRVAAAVVGVGLNVRTLDFPEDLASRCTSLARELRRTRPSPWKRAAPPQMSAPSGATPFTAEMPLRLDELLAELLTSFDARYRRYLRDGLASFLPELEACDALRGRSVRIDHLTGTALGIASSGALRVLDASGEVHDVHAGHVELVDANAP